MSPSVAGFDWDAGNREKCRKHGVSLGEIEQVFRAVVAIRPDLPHSQDETRFLGVGQTAAGRHVLVAFTLRERSGARLIRPISARYMHSKEVARYEQADT